MEMSKAVQKEMDYYIGEDKIGSMMNHVDRLNRSIFRPEG